MGLSAHADVGTLEVEDSLRHNFLHRFFLDLRRAPKDAPRPAVALENLLAQNNYEKLGLC